jgi:hypothetical protein
MRPKLSLLLLFAFITLLTLAGVRTAQAQEGGQARVTRA